MVACVVFAIEMFHLPELTCCIFIIIIIIIVWGKRETFVILFFWGSGKHVITYRMCINACLEMITKISVTSHPKGKWLQKLEEGISVLTPISLWILYSIVGALF